MTRSLPTRLGSSGEVEDEGHIFWLLPWHWVGSGAESPVGPELPPSPAPQPPHAAIHHLPHPGGLRGEGPGRFGLGDEDFFQLLSYSVGSTVAIARW